MVLVYFIWKESMQIKISNHRSRAIAAIENVDKNMPNPSKEPAILHIANPKGQNVYNTCKIFSAQQNNVV